MMIIPSPHRAMTRARIDLSQLALFDALIAERHLTRAAARVGMAQPTASKALDRLRDLFGDALFLRAGGGMRPTPRALDLAPEVAALIAQAQRLVARELRFDPAAAQGTLRIAMSDAAEAVLLPPLVARIAAAAPGVTLRARMLDKDRAFADLDAGRLDLLVGVFPDLPPRLAAHDLFDEGFVCLVRQDHPCGDRALTLPVYAALPHVLVTQRDDARGAVDAALARHGLQRRVVATLGRFLSVPAVLAATDAVATVPARFAARAAGCRLLAPPLDIPGWTERLIWRRGADRDPRTARAIAQVAAAAAGV